MSTKERRVQLSPLCESDLPDLLGWINDRDQALLNAPYKPVSSLQQRSWYLALENRTDVYIFGVRLVENNELIGTCQLHTIHPVHRTAELQIRIGNEARRHAGYGTEALLNLLKFGFHDLNLNRIYLHVFQSNHSAIRAYEKIGFKEEGILREAAYIDGAYVDVIVMGLLRAEYEKS